MNNLYTCIKHAEDYDFCPICEIESARKVIIKIANVAHHGGLIGMVDINTAMNEIRKLTLPYWDKEECSRLQLDQDV